MNHMLHRAHAAKVAIETARTPMEKHFARQDGLAVKADLEKRIADDAALAAFKSAQPQSSVGVWKGAPVSDRPVFMTGPAGLKIVGPIKLPDGGTAIPNPQGQIVVAMPLVAEMLRRGFLRVNDTAITNLSTTTPTPARLQHV